MTLHASQGRGPKVPILRVIPLFVGPTMAAEEFFEPGHSANRTVIFPHSEAVRVGNHRFSNSMVSNACIALISPIV